MFAIIKTGGKQYKVSEGDVIEIELTDAKKEGEKIDFDQVLLVDDGKDAKVGQPILEKAKVEGKLKAESKGDKINIIKQKPKKRYLKRQGHTQRFQQVEITKIEA